MIKVGSRIHPDWLESEGDQDLHFLKQIGVDYVDITLDMVKGYKETGCFERDDLFALVDRLDRAGLKIERANTLAPYYKDAHLGRPEGQRQIDNLCKIAELLGEAGIPLMGIQCFSAVSLVHQRRPGWVTRKGRGGYQYHAFDLGLAEGIHYEPEARITAEQLWEGLLNIYRQVVPVAEEARVRIAMHGNDPPLPFAYGNPQVLCRFADFDRLFREVPNANNGMTFCVGTRYESGQDIFEGIKHFGQQGRLFHVHFRNVRGTLPRTRGYEEVFLDDGDLNMRDVLLALHSVGYDHVIDFDHVMRISGDSHHGRQYIAFAVGYMKGLIAGLPG